MAAREPSADVDHARRLLLLPATSLCFSYRHWRKPERPLRRLGRTNGQYPAPVRFWLALLLGSIAAATFGLGTFVVDGSAGPILQIAGLVLGVIVGFVYTGGHVLP